MKSLLLSTVGIVVAIVAVWFIAGLLGFHISLLWTIILSVGVTVLLNLPALMRRR